MKLLFICNQNKHRSRTAEEVFRPKFETKSAGLFNLNPVKESDIEWADKIAVMEEFQRGEIARRFPKLYLKKQIINLDVSDEYSYNQPELVALLKSKENLL